MYHICVCYTQGSKEGTRSPGMGVTDGCELPHGCWELNPGPLEEQTVLSPLSYLSSPSNGSVNISFLCFFLFKRSGGDLVLLNHRR